MLRCKNLHQAIEFHKCFIPEVAFRCTYNSDWAECIKMLPFDLNSLENFNSLPQHELFFDGKEIYIEHKFQPVEIELHLVNYNISLLNYNPNCVVKIEEFDGCYSCLRGIRIKSKNTIKKFSRGENQIHLFMECFVSIPVNYGKML